MARAVRDDREYSDPVSQRRGDGASPARAPGLAGRTTSSWPRQGADASTGSWPFGDWSRRPGAPGSSQRPSTRTCPGPRARRSGAWRRGLPAGCTRTDHPPVHHSPLKVAIRRPRSTSRTSLGAGGDAPGALSGDDPWGERRTPNRRNRLYAALRDGGGASDDWTAGLAGPVPPALILEPGAGPARRHQAPRRFSWPTNPQDPAVEPKGSNLRTAPQGQGPRCRPPSVNRCPAHRRHRRRRRRIG